MSTSEPPQPETSLPAQGPPPGWWQASDGKWYPPQTGQAPPPPGQGGPTGEKKKKGCIKTALLALAVLIALIVVIVIATGGGGDDDATTNDGTGEEAGEADEAETAEEALFPGRPDVKENDKERNIGESAELSGYTVTVNSALFQQEVSEFETDGYITAEVTILNRDAEAQSYNPFEWKLITPGGTIIDPTFTSTEQLGSGDLVQDGTVTGQLTWEVGAEKGDYYVIYDPTDLGDDRAIWKVTV